MVYVFLALYEGAGFVVLFVINNPGSVIVVVSSPSDDEGAGAIVVVPAVVDILSTVFSIIVIDKVAGAVVIDITVTVVPWYPIVVIILDVGTIDVFVSNVVVLVNIVEIKTTS